MQIAVMSDSHGHGEAIARVLENEPTVSVVIHLGDGAGEAQDYAAAHPEKRWHIIRGNCDYDTAPPRNEVVTFGGCRLYLTHGHAEHVKSGLLTLALTAREQECRAALYGHTHIPATDFREGMLLLNPGSLRDSGTYAVLTVENGQIRSDMHRL